MTEYSTPVGSGRLFMYFSSNYRTSVLPHSGFPPTTLFKNGLLIITLRTKTERTSLSTFLSLFILALVPSVARTYTIRACDSRFDLKVTFGGGGRAHGERVDMSERTLRRCITLYGCIGYIAHPLKKEALWTVIASLFLSVRGTDEEGNRSRSPEKTPG